MRSTSSNLLIVLGLAACSLYPKASATDLGPDGWQPHLSALVGTLLQSQHYLHPTIDDATATEWLSRFIDTLDYGHMVFLQSDVDRLRATYGTRLDDDLSMKKPKVDAAFDVYKTYITRLDERMRAADAALSAPMDFTVSERFTYDREDAPFPATAADADTLWRARVKADVLQGELAGKARAEQVEMLRKRYQRLLKEMRELEPPDVLELYLGALCQTIDPHTTWFKPATNDDFDIDMSNSVEGIGATLQTEDGYTVVRELVPGGPADVSGLLHKDDKIIAVAQEGQPPQDIVDLRIDKVVRQIRGPKGTRVTLTVIPYDATDNSQTRQITILRDKVAIQSQDAKQELIQVPKTGGGSWAVGVVTVPSFYIDGAAKEAGVADYNSSTNDVRRLLGELRAAGAQAVVVDLRENGGGSLSEAVDLTGLFIDRGPVVQIRAQDGDVERMSDSDAGVAWDGPLVVLTSELSASASEIFAGAIQDYGRGLVVGSTTTHGKGSVQTVMDVDRPLRAMLDDLPRENIGGALKITTHKFYRVSGASTQREGVRADVALPSPYDGMEIAEKDLDHALPWDEVTPLKHPTLGDPRRLASSLQAASDARVATDNWFRWQAEDVAARKAREADPSVSLVLAERQAEKAADEQRDIARGLLVITPAADPTKPPEKKREEAPDYLREEAMRVTRDYLEALPR